MLSLFSAVLLSLAWYWKLSIAAFFAFVPLLILEDQLTSGSQTRQRLKLWGYAYLTFLVWNLLVTWWVVCASLGGALMAFLCNALLMSWVFCIFSSVKNRLGKSWGVWLLIPLWLAFEHIHTLWDISWTWLSLGNLFAFNHNWVQWYEYTGASGGALWVLFVNVFIFRVIKKNPSLRFFSRPVYITAACIILPILFSQALVLIKKPARQGKGVKTLVVQPNIDPYNTKFSLDFQQQFFKFMNLVRCKIRPETEYLVLPETFITENFNEAFLAQSPEIQWFRDSLIAKFPNLKIITGGNTYVVYKDKKDITATARKDEHSGEYYDEFNSGILITGSRVEVYHKSRLVPGVERMPFPALLRPLESFAINMGGTMGSLGTQAERSVFADSLSHTAIAPVICYESIYSDYVTAYMRRHANLIFIITNDGWWDNTPGYIQHLNYARLRAIENRREIARCANTGISCFIDELGNISQPSAWWQEAVIEQDLYPNNTLTFFSRYGDLLSYASVTLSCFLIVFWLYSWFLKRPGKQTPFN